MIGTVLGILVVLVIAAVLIKVGLALLRGLGTPLPPPPPPGEMRKVNLKYRCSVCGAEVKMTLATEELPDAPRHCQEDMDLVAPVE
ncbi:MAG TPA: hypothetical protein VGF22_03330 [Acidimicrobiales bacterium]